MKKVSTITEFDVVTKYINSFGRDSDDDSYMCKTFFFKSVHYVSVIQF